MIMTITQFAAFAEIEEKVPFEYEESEEFRTLLERPFESGSYSRPAAIKNASYDPQLFYQLRLNEEDRHNIRKLIKNMADWSIWELLKKAGEMKKLGDKIAPVHPIRFIGFILSTPDLKKRLKTMREESSFKWGKFIDGFGERMSKEFRHNNLYPYVPGFCQLLGRNPASVNHFIEKQDWDGLVGFLLH